jgi:hypothetical protein
MRNPRHGGVDAIKRFQEHLLAVAGKSFESFTMGSDQLPKVKIKQGKILYLLLNLTGAEVLTEDFIGNEDKRELLQTLWDLYAEATAIASLSDPAEFRKKSVYFGPIMMTFVSLFNACYGSSKLTPYLMSIYSTLPHFLSIAATFNVTFFNLFNMVGLESQHFIRTKQFHENSARGGGRLPTKEARDVSTLNSMGKRMMFVLLGISDDRKGSFEKRVLRAEKKKLMVFKYALIMYN